ncbi:MAG: inorganic phosphate transporter [Candidatus Bathyarchaeota archaeon]|jgi:PiT family inorganic phosphate transporter
METHAAFSLFIACYVAWSIGANDETVAPLAGSGAFSLRTAVVLGGVSAMLGALLIGQRVETTLGEGILSFTVTETETMVILFSLASWLTVNSYFGWPISTTHSSVGAIIGLAIAKGGTQSVRWSTLGYITISWAVSPLIGFVGSIFIHRVTRLILRPRVKGLIAQMKLARRSTSFLAFWVLLTSFSRGANDIANATAILGDVAGLNPLVLRGLVAVGMALGLIVVGRKVIRAVGVDLVKLDPISALSSQIAVALTMLIGTYLGIPLSGTHILVGAVVGLGVSKGIWVNLKGVREITYTWLATFVGAAALSGAAYMVVSSL